MSDWTWEYVPDAAHVVGGLNPSQIDEVDVRSRVDLTRIVTHQ
jgi:hypothetical protein